MPKEGFEAIRYASPKSQPRSKITKEGECKTPYAVPLMPVGATEEEKGGNALKVKKYASHTSMPIFPRYRVIKVVECVGGELGARRSALGARPHSLSGSELQSVWVCRVYMCMKEMEVASGEMYSCSLPLGGT